MGRGSRSSWSWFPSGPDTSPGPSVTPNRGLYRLPETLGVHGARRRGEDKGEERDLRVAAVGLADGRDPSDLGERYGHRVETGRRVRMRTTVTSREEEPSRTSLSSTRNPLFPPYFGGRVTCPPDVGLEVPSGRPTLS